MSAGTTMYWLCDLHLDPTAPEPVINDVAFRSPAALPVEFTPA
jgi:hypothetical protein